MAAREIDRGSGSSLDGSPVRLVDNVRALSEALPLTAVLATAVLMFPAGARVFGGAQWGLATVAVFITTPLAWHAVQIAPHALYPLPFVAGALAAAAHWKGAGTPWWWPAAAGAALGAGMAASPAAVVMMPVYLVLTVTLGLVERALTPKHCGIVTGAFVLGALPAIVSLLTPPDDYRALVSAYRLYDVQRFTVLQGIREMTSWVGLTARTEVYYDFFNPAFLFLTGDVLLFPLALLLPIGLLRLVTNETGLMARLALLGFLVAPLAASLTAEPPAPGRILFLTPFAALVAVFGVVGLVGRAGRANRVGGVGAGDVGTESAGEVRV